MSRLILASRSFIRRKLLSDAGVVYDAIAADLDEDAIAVAFAEPASRALALAIAKAQAISVQQPGAHVLGADQVGVLDDGTYLEKPKDPADHVRLLLSMQGRAHRFFPAAVLVKDGAVVDRVQDQVTVRFRSFSVDEARAYVATGEGSGSCGGYESENRGAQLIEAVEGSLHAVLGLPLFGTLAMLRRAGVGVGLIAPPQNT